MFSHEASIIVTKERAEIRMIEFFIARKIVVDGAGHSITRILDLLLNTTRNKADEFADIQRKRKKA